LGFRGALSEALLLYFRISGLASIWQSSEQGSESLATSVDAQVRVDDVAIHRVVEVSSAWHSSDRVGRWPSRLVAAAAENRLNIRLHSAHLVCGGVHALTALAFIRHFFGVIWAA
jgi:hypothetical protein